MVLKNKEKALNRKVFPDICKRVADKLGEDLEVVEKIMSHYFYFYHLIVNNPFLTRINIPNIGTIIPRYNKIRRTAIAKAGTITNSDKKNYTQFINRLFVLKRLQLEGEKRRVKGWTYKLTNTNLSNFLKLVRKYGDYNA